MSLTVIIRPCINGKQLNKIINDTNSAAAASATSGDTIPLVKDATAAANRTATLRNVSAKTCCKNIGLKINIL